MRGRWHWVLLGALIIGPLAALGGWLSTHPTWRATATVSLALSGSATPEPTADASTTSPTPLGGPWQNARLDEVLERELDLLKQVGGAPSTARRVPDTLTRLEITVRTDHADDTQRLLAAALAAYRAQTQLIPEAQRADELDARARSLDQRRIDLAQRRRNAAAGLPDTPDAPATGDAPPLGFGDAELHWQAATAAANTAQRRAAIATRHAQVLLDLAPPKMAELAAVDPETRRLTEQLNALNDALHNTSRPPSPLTAERINQRDALDAQLRARQADTRLMPSEPVADQAQPEPAHPRAVSVNAALAEAAQLEAIAADAAQRMSTLEPQLSEQRRRGAALDADAQALRADTAELSRQRAALGPGGGAVRLADTPALAPTPSVVVDHDPRPRRAALAWLVGGAVGGLLPMLWFLSDRRVRRTRHGELVGNPTPLLGTVPVMDQSQASGDNAAPGPVESIDAVRAVLEARIESGDHAFAVAGVTAGSGASSIAVGLAVSMAMAGQRVLLVDLSWLQTPTDTPTPGTDTQAGRGVDGVIDELGYLDDEDRERLALSQYDLDESDDIDPVAQGGFTALLAGAPLDQSVLETRLPRLSVLSALGRGQALRHAWTGRLSSKWLRRLVDVCRDSGYVMVIDAGAADGGVEGVLTCAAADGALVVVTSRETQAGFVRCTSRLKLVGAQVIGTVLNRHGQRRIAAGNPDRRRIAAGGTRGSGLFAAAIEARRGDDARSAPLPHHDQPAPDAAPDADPDAAHHPADPIDEPPATVQPTPQRKPPAPLTGDRSAPEVHVVDDVMDQLVDHAIRSAQTGRRGAAPPAGAVGPKTPTRADPT